VPNGIGAVSEYIEIQIVLILMPGVLQASMCLEWILVFFQIHLDQEIFYVK
jgi:hypothetical protein